MSNLFIRQRNDKASRFVSYVFAICHDRPNGRVKFSRLADSGERRLYEDDAATETSESIGNTYSFLLWSDKCE